MSLIDDLLCPICRDLYVDEEEKPTMYIYWHTKDVVQSDGSLSSTWCELPRPMPGRWGGCRDMLVPQQEAADQHLHGSNDNKEGK